MTNTDTTASWTGRRVLDRDGSKLGTLKHVYLSRSGDTPTWGVVKKPFGSARLVPLAEATVGRAGLQVPVTKTHVRSAPSIKAGSDLSAETESRLQRHYTARDALSATQDRQHEAYGGFKIGAAFFGWIVAIGLAAILVALLGAVATAVGFSIDIGAGQAQAQAQQAAGPIGIVGGVLLLVTLMIAYYAGGYVAGRLARFDGARNGFGAWVLGIVVAIALAVAGAVAGAQYNLLQQVRIPTIPIPTETVTAGGLITLAVIVLGTALAAVLGGKAGERYHHKVDRAGAGV